MHKLPLQYSILCAALFSSVTLAQTIYKTIDEKGVVSFSDTRPQPDLQLETLQIETLQLAIAEPQDHELDATLGEARMHTLRVTTDRMIADRMARENHRAELRKIRAQTTALEAQSPYDSYQQPPQSYTVVYPVPLFHRGVLRKRNGSMGDLSPRHRRTHTGPRPRHSRRHHEFLWNRK